MFRRLYIKLREFFGFDAEANKDPMTSNPSTKPWIHIGNCPVCKDGLARIRACRGDGEGHLYALYDECESYWLSPSLEVEPSSVDPEDPLCPVCKTPMSCGCSDWATESDLVDTVWLDQVMID